MDNRKAESSISADEQFAIHLQAEFDKEYNLTQQTEEKDRKLALQYAAAHTFSDTESESGDSNTDTKKRTLDIKVNHQSDSDSTDVDMNEVMKKHTEPSSNGQKRQAAPHCKKALSKNPIQSLQLPKDASEKLDQTSGVVSTEQLENRPICKYGNKCYRKNAEHLKEFKHPNTRVDTDNYNDVPSAKRIKTKKENEAGFYLSKVKGISTIHNEDVLALDIKDILSSSMGNLNSSAQFSYLFDIPWLIQQYPPESRNKPLLLIHGEKQESKMALTRDAQPYKNISLCQAPLDVMFGTHHTKMMFLLYEEGLRIVIHTANLISDDWHQKTQGIWLSPIFPKLSGPPSILNGESETLFKRDMLEYLTAYKVKALSEWCEHIKQHDLTAARVYLIGSVPGRHVGEQKVKFGHMKLRKVLRDAGPEATVTDKNWPVIGQFSSIGSLGATANQWLTGEWLGSLGTTKKSNSLTNAPKLQLIFPSVDNVRVSLEGYPAGASLPYSNKVAVKQRWLESYFHQWKSEIHGRNCASPHIKTYARISPNYSQIAWILLTSANLSKAAWGALEKKEMQLAIRSYELGVLFLPRLFGKAVFDVANMEVTVPFDIPPTPYGKQDEPWVWDVAHTDAPDRHGNAWQPQ